MIENKQALLNDIAAGVKRESRHEVDVLEVVFVTPEGEEFVFELGQALDALANDSYWDERGNWANATSARVRVI